MGGREIDIEFWWQSHKGRNGNGNLILKRSLEK
jgi:hypothetical protein